MRLADQGRDRRHLQRPAADPRSPDKVNLWIPDNGSAIAIEALANGVEGIGGAATLIVNRNLR